MRFLHPREMVDERGVAHYEFEAAKIPFKILIKELFRRIFK